MIKNIEYIYFMVELQEIKIKKGEFIHIYDKNGDFLKIE